MPSAITLNDEPILLEDALPQVGQTLPFFSLVNHTMDDITLDAFAGKRKILHIFPSVDTPTSANSVRKLDALASDLENTVLLNISADLPFAAARFCALESLGRGIHLSTLRGRDMLKHYGVLMVTSKLAGLPARAVIVADEQNTILYIELVTELTQEPDFTAALATLATNHSPTN